MQEKLSKRIKKSVKEGIRNIRNIFEGVVVEALFAIFLLVIVYTISYLLVLVV